MEEVAPVVTGPLAEALARGRAEYNARVAAARRSTPVLDDGALAATLRRFDSIVRGVHAHAADRVDSVVSALFDAALLLVPSGGLGPGARRPELAEAWRAVIEAAPRLLCADPRRVLAATFNALTHLSDTPGTRPADWVRAMSALAALAPDVGAWLDAGVVAGWRAGLAHARAGALDVAGRLPATLAAVALDLDAVTPPDAMERVIARLREDPWTWPPHVVSGEEHPVGLKLVCYVGAFRGFGTGRFIAPPRVGLRDGVFHVSDGERTFELHADFFGATLTVVGPATEPPHTRGAVTLEPGGAVVWTDQRRVFPGLADVSSWASNDFTLAATREISHQIAVVARSRYGL